MSDLKNVIDADERTANLCMNRGQRIKELERQLVSLEAENRSLKRLLIEQARLLDVSDLSAPASSVKQHSAMKRLEGAGAGSSVLAGVRVDAGIDEC